MDKEQYCLNDQWDKCIVTVIDGVVIHINLLHLFSEHPCEMPNICRIASISEGGGAVDRIKFQENKALRPLIKKHEWLPWDIFKEEVALIGWKYWNKL